ncbi:hypothetical protein COCOBI_02-5060 [Coccomyxa sp. Obi]|nr:hypothetical protein COCOBI_02-4870 [Coccomyxa sp. Obi]BDA41710.1 hypothetical protein COCOBI_02-4970 [Coccomyxa sp. Obi]BDA41716.1 hypothetical protein COCOBI_02-5060 [Coccomyxa sp. Obi]
MGPRLAPSAGSSRGWLQLQYNYTEMQGCGSPIADPICAPVADPPQAARGAPVAGAPWCPRFPPTAPAGRSAGGEWVLIFRCRSGGSSDPHSPLPPEVDRPRGSRQTACGVGLEKENAACGWCPCSAGNSVEGMGDWNPEGPIGQIVRTTAESQKIVAARPLYFLQHRVRAKSSARDLPQ